MAACMHDVHIITLLQNDIFGAGPACNDLHDAHSIGVRGPLKHPHHLPAQPQTTTLFILAPSTHVCSAVGTKSVQRMKIPCAAHQRCILVTSDQHETMVQSKQLPSQSESQHSGGYSDRLQQSSCPHCCKCCMHAPPNPALHVQPCNVDSFRYLHNVKTHRTLVPRRC